MVNEFFDLDVNDINLDPLEDSSTVPLTHASDSTYRTSEIMSNASVPQTEAWTSRDQRMTSQYPHGQRQPVSNSSVMTSVHNNYVAPGSGMLRSGGVAPGVVSPQGISSVTGNARIVSPEGVPRSVVSPQGVPPGVMSPQGVPSGVMSPQGVPRSVVSPQGVPRGVVSPQGLPPPPGASRNMPRNGVSANGQFYNGPSSYQPVMTTSQPLPSRGNTDSRQTGLLQVQTQPMANRSMIKSEPVRSTGYYCNSGNMDSALPGGLTNGPPYPGMSPQSNAYKYNKLNHGGMPQWTTAPPSPYSSGSSSTSSYDALHVQFSPTEILSSPFASPRDDSEYNRGNKSTSVPLPGQPYPNGSHPQRSFTRPPPDFPQPFINIPEIAPMGMVEELAPGMQTSPLTSRTTVGLTHM